MPIKSFIGKVGKVGDVRRKKNLHHQQQPLDVTVSSSTSPNFRNLTMKKLTLQQYKFILSFVHLANVFRAQLTSCVHALSAVLYPMYWQHIFIPVLPPHLLDYTW